MTKGPPTSRFPQKLCRHSSGHPAKKLPATRLSGKEGEDKVLGLRDLRPAGGSRSMRLESSGGMPSQAPGIGKDEVFLFARGGRVEGEAGPASRRGSKRQQGEYEGERGLKRSIMGLVVFAVLVGTAAAEVAAGSAPRAALGGVAAVDDANVSTGAAATCNKTEEVSERPNAGKAALIIAAFEAFRDHPLGLLGFVLWLTVWTTFALPVTPLEVCAGFVFGPIWGTFGSLLAKTLGCVCAMFIGRFLGTSRGWKVPQALEKYMTFLLSHPLQAMCAIRVAPIPLGVKNYGLSLVSFPGAFPTKEYIWACVLVGAPFSVAWCLTGHGAHSLAEIVARYS